MPKESARSIEPLWTVEDVATYTGLHPKTIYRFVAEGRLHPRRIGKCLRFDPSDFRREPGEPEGRAS